MQHEICYLKGWIASDIQTNQVRKCCQSIHITKLVAGRT